MFKRGITESALKALGVIAPAKLGRKFYLAGGTAAALQIGHRLSVDLDYFSAEPFGGEEIIEALESEGIAASKLNPSKGALHCIIAETKVSFLYYQYPLLEPTKRYQETELAPLLDIALMKITAIASRSMKKDFIDLYFILQEISLQFLLDSFPRKYPVEKLDPYHYLRSLTYFDDAENDPMPQMLAACDWQEVKKFLQTSVRRLSLA